MEVPFAMALQRKQDAQAEGSERRLHAARHDRARVLPGVAARRSHRHDATAQDALRRLLVAYGEGLEGEAALAKGLGASTDKLQATFDKALDRRASRRCSARCASPSNDGPSTPRAGARSLAALKAAADADPGSYAAQLALGHALAEAGDAAAFAPLERAAALVPVADRRGQPARADGALAEKLGDLPRAIARLSRAARPRSHRGRAGAPAGGAGREGRRRSGAAAGVTTGSSRSIRSTPPRTPARAGWR